jgi:hypothetical protein
MPDGLEMKMWPAAKRVAALKAEMEGRFAALSGGEAYEQHQRHLRYLGAEIWELEQSTKAARKP